MKTKISFLLLAVALLFSCQQTQTGETNKIKKGMIKVAILYPNGEGKTFDMDYYSPTQAQASRLCHPKYTSFSAVIAGEHNI